MAQLWGAGRLCQRRVQPMEFLLSCGGSREGQELPQALPWLCNAQGSASVGAAAKSCFEYISNV